VCESARCVRPLRTRTIRASEVGAYLFCHRAWWYQRSGQPSENMSEMAAGAELHERHGRLALESGCLRTAAYVLLLLALALLAAYLASQFM
jgi:hypothetical protein